MSEAAYDKVRDNIGDYNVDNDLSDERHAVYYNPKTNKAVLSYRGTADFGDIQADAALVGGLPHKAFDDAIEKYDQVRYKYGDRSASNIHLTGHSLGGAKVHHVLNNYDNKTTGTTFNPGATPFTKLSKKAKNFTVLGDPISNSALGSNTVALRPSSNPHTISNFTGSSLVNGVPYEEYQSFRGSGWDHRLYNRITGGNWMDVGLAPAKFLSGPTQSLMNYEPPEERLMKDMGHGLGKLFKFGAKAYINHKLNQ